MRRAAACAAIAALLAGCGGEARLSTAEFRQGANSICARYNAKIKAAVAGVSNDRRSLANKVDRAIRYIEQGTKELDALKPPKRDDEKYAALSRANHEQIATAKRLADAARSNDRRALEASVAKLEAQGARSDALARALGLSSCASD